MGLALRGGQGPGDAVLSVKEDAAAADGDAKIEFIRSALFEDGGRCHGR